MEDLIEFVVEVGIKATDVEDALKKWRHSGKPMSVVVGAPRGTPKGLVPAFPTSTGAIPDEVTGQTPS